MQSQHQSAFDAAWKTAASILQYIATEVDNFYLSPNRQIFEMFKLKGSVLPAYSIVFDLCNGKPAYKDVMFSKYRNSLEGFVLGKERDTDKEHGQNIRQFNVLWESYAMFMLTISKRVFSYLDRYYVKALQQGSLSRVGLNIFKELLLDPKQKDYIFNQYVQELGRIREKRIITNRELLKFSQSLAVVDEKVLFPELVQIFLKESESFYEHFYQQNKHKDPLLYLSAVSNLTFFEKMLARSSICISSFQSQLQDKLFESIVVGKYTDKLVSDQDGLKKYLREGNMVALKIINDLYAKFEGFEKIRKVVYQFVLGEGEKMFLESFSTKNIDVKAKVNITISIENLQAFYLKTNTLIAEGFQKQKQIEVSFKNAIQKITQMYEHFSQDLLLYTREILDRGQFDERKKSVRMLFQLLPSKDQFLHLYEASVQKKILDGSFIYLIEKRFVIELSDICGSQSTARIDKKIQDFVECLPVCSDFIKDLSSSSSKILFNAKVLSFQLWENKFDEQITLNINLVEPMLSFWTQFQNLYSQQFQKRRLLLLPFESKLILNISFKEIQLRVKCNLLQACIIFKLSTSPQARGVSQEEIVSQLMIQKMILDRFLGGNLPKFIREISPGLYSIDWNFRTNQILMDLDQKLSQEDRKIPKSIMQDRDILVEAAIMKAMKRLKQASFQVIVGQVHARIRIFKPLPTHIKVSMQKLIRKEMLEEGENGLLKYVQ